jgi:chromosomal replication initiation ATPase DnaA
LEEIGAFFGGRDHSTVQHAQMKIEAACLKDSSLAMLANQLEECLLTSNSRFEKDLRL